MPRLTVEISADTGEVLEFRHNEILHFYTDWNEAYDMRAAGFLYAVRCLSAEALPSQLRGDVIDIGGYPVIGYRYIKGNPDTWIRIYLSERTKQAIGKPLENFQADYPNQWVYLLVRRATEKREQCLEFKAEGLPYPIPFWLNVDRPAEEATNYKCRVDLNLCPESFVQALLSSRWEYEQLLTQRGFINPTKITLWYVARDEEDAPNS
jgi:hypothetical protein